MSLTKGKPTYFHTDLGSLPQRIESDSIITCQKPLSQAKPKYHS